MSVTDNELIQSGSFDPYNTWRTLVTLNPVADFDHMSEEERTVAICLETYDGKLRNYRGSVTFDRFANTASYHFLLSVYHVKDVKNPGGKTLEEELADTIDIIPLRLTSRFTWSTDAEKVKDL
ncbi:hypothetical protein SEMRO_15_G010830.1 [Seminavis robusta]|uniref:Uncharacterized protein n=1 Tax=Seminavis robusta TaxID=568900 RepID=A0A9N8H4X4_9STRA|nr:hypothetical protein SEMRO_15_G010820.1 [Seminavis robusta]CAB9497129.1 hypothetical protein SEMRO_15_G010830.1 [Seminavis robusta]|eukprot:Sro15_g010820.1 n/a (123) ;mRNA; f:3745-4220